MNLNPPGDRLLGRRVRFSAVARALLLAWALAACGEKGELGSPRQSGPLTQEQELIQALGAEATRGDASAQVNLGVMYLRGEGVARNVAKAVALFQRAADQGNATAQVNLGLMYAKGEGVAPDLNKGLDLLRKAEAQGDPDAQVNLGLMFIRGDQVGRDVASALALFRKAAAQGHPLAQNNLGVMYQRGEGVARDAALAAKWYEQAAVQGEPGAQASLGSMYAAGDGVPKDLVLALIWSSLAARYGLEQAVKNRDVLAAQLSPEEKTEAQRLIDAWKKNQLPARAARAGSSDDGRTNPAKSASR